MSLHKKITFIIAALCMVCFAAGVQAETDHGPTVTFDYSENSGTLNPIGDFMYFVPSISLVSVDNISSYGNSQMFQMVSCDKKVKSKSFKTVVEFQIHGDGHHVNTYDPEGMIAENLQYIKKGKPLQHMLEYIKLEGDGRCIVTIKGRIKDGCEIAEQLDIKFETGKQKSPVTVGLYTVRPVDGKYEYQNCQNKVTARIRSLTFKRTDERATVKIKVAALLNKNGKEDMFSMFAGSVANMATKPIFINNDGNETMLDFGFAMHQNLDTFTFPKAKNLSDGSIRTNKQYSTNAN